MAYLTVTDTLGLTALLADNLHPDKPDAALRLASMAATTGKWVNPTRPRSQGPTVKLTPDKLHPEGLHVVTGPLGGGALLHNDDEWRAQWMILLADGESVDLLMDNGADAWAANVARVEIPEDASPRVKHALVVDALEAARRG